jgi:hypothetical protein
VLFDHIDERTHDVRASEVVDHSRRRRTHIAAQFRHLGVDLSDAFCQSGFFDHWVFC